jgi:hypothetical protein
MTEARVAETVVRAGTAMSPYPSSFGDNPYLYALALAAILAIAVFGLIIAGWMVREIWRFRFVDHPRSLAFLYRIMILLAASAAFVRSAPEVVYMTIYGDPGTDPKTVAAVLTIKRAMDTIALPSVAGWMAVFVATYPFVIIALRDRTTKTIEVDLVALWPRAARPLLIFLCVMLIASLMAIAKGYGIAR